MATMKTEIHARLKPETYRKLVEIANSNELTLSDIVRHAIFFYLDSHEQALFAGRKYELLKQGSSLSLIKSCDRPQALPEIDEAFTDLGNLEW